MSKDVFLGVVDRRGAIYLPWRGTHIFIENDYEPDTNLLVTLEINNVGCAKVVKVDLPTLQQIKAMKDELTSDWERFSGVFQSSPMLRKVKMLHALDNVMRLEN